MFFSKTNLFEKLFQKYYSYCGTAERLKDFLIRSDDVVIVTYPKSGTTWMSELLWLLVNDLDYDGAKSDSIMIRVPFLE